MPETYTHGHHESVLRSHRWRSAANSCAYVLDRLGPGTDLLDVGCGPGTITAGLARHVAPGRVVGLDRSAEQLRAQGLASDDELAAIAAAWRRWAAAHDGWFTVVHGEVLCRP
jgi:cyclopropane fatty-acyl-phospholipid synthase-like methyltransferase